MDEIRFDWDLWNVQKNEIKHGVSALEVESCFFDPGLVIFCDNAHSTAREKRHIAYARSVEDRVLMLGFTVRRKRIRIITARTASMKEKRIYEISPRSEAQGPQKRRSQRDQ